MFNFTGAETQNPGGGRRRGDSFADFLLGYPASVAALIRERTSAVSAGISNTSVRMTFDVNSKLTVNIGLRYEYSPWLNGYKGPARHIRSDAGQADHRRRQYQPGGSDLAVCSPCRLPVLRAIHPDQQPGRLALLNHLYRSHAVRSASRICLAAARQRTPSIRGGFGIFYEPEGTSGRVNRNILPVPVVGDGESDRERSAQSNHRELLPRLAARFCIGESFDPADSDSPEDGIATSTTASQYSSSYRPRPFFDIAYVGNHGAPSAKHG